MPPSNLVLINDIWAIVLCICTTPRGKIRCSTATLVSAQSIYLIYLQYSFMSVKVFDVSVLDCAVGKCSTFRDNVDLMALL